MAEGATWTMGQTGRVAGVIRKAIRVYEARGLVCPAGRTAAGYRLFSAADVDTLRFIRRARALGLGLDDVAEVLAQRRGGVSPCASVRDRIAGRVVEIDHAIGELAALRASLVGAAEQCPPDASEDGICPTTETSEAGDQA